MRIREKLRNFLDTRVQRLSSTNTNWKPDFSCNLEQLFDEALGDGPTSIEQILLAFSVSPPDELSLSTSALQFNSQVLLEEERAIVELFREPAPSTPDQVRDRCVAWRELASRCHSTEESAWLVEFCYYQVPKLRFLSYQLETVQLIGSSMFDQIDEQLTHKRYFAAQQSLLLYTHYLRGIIPTGPRPERLHSPHLSGRKELSPTDADLLRLGFRTDFLCKWNQDLVEQLQFNTEQLHKLRYRQLKIITKDSLEGQEHLLVKCMRQGYAIAIRFRNLIDQWATRLLQHTFCLDNDLPVLQVIMKDAPNMERLKQSLKEAVRTDCPTHWVSFSGATKVTTNPYTLTLEQLNANGSWKVRHQLSILEEGRTGWSFHLQLLPADSFASFRMIYPEGCLEFKLGESVSTGELKVSPAQSQWIKHIDQKMDDFLMTKEGVYVLKLFHSIQPFSGANHPNWYPLLISITNKAKHEEEALPLLDNIRDAQRPDELLYFQVEDSSFSYHSFLENASAGVNCRLQASIELFNTLKKLKLLSNNGKADELLLDQKEEKDLIEILKQSKLLKELQSSFNWETVADRIWRHRNLVVKEQKGNEDYSVSEDSFVGFCHPSDKSLQAEDSCKLFQALSCHQVHENSVSHDKNTPICGNCVATNCDLKLAKLRTKWEGFTKPMITTPDGRQIPGKGKGRTLQEDFAEDKLLDFLKLKQKQARLSQRTMNGQLPIPQHFHVVPFLQAILKEVSQVMLSLDKICEKRSRMDKNNKGSPP